jgi:hypothetical protein
MFLVRHLLRSDCVGQAGLLQGFLLSGVHNERSLVSRLEGTTTLQEQANGAAIFACLDSYCDGHHDAFQKRVLAQIQLPR